MAHLQNLGRTSFLAATVRPGMTENARKLLIVEDDPGLLKQLKWCFEGYDVYTA